MAHKFTAKSKHKLDNEQRRSLMPPYETLQKFGLASGADVADIGCGIGYFTIPAGKIVGSSAIVYALDILPEMLAEVAGRAAETGLTNIRTIQVGEYDFKLADRAVDFIIMSNVLHETDDHDLFFSEALRILRAGGRMAVIEWRKIAGSPGPPIEHRLSPEEVRDLALKRGMEEFYSIDFGQGQYGLVFVKN
ncbi:MAG: Demethylmenaquinone methyltransferase [Pelotomaculum sp. PtaB.Bin104]|nr:MAG: Demethylmenaquinone methyltransferase [Pelotomaculum sp. PtaB.Bin104]